MSESSQAILSSAGTETQGNTSPTEQPVGTTVDPNSNQGGEAEAPIAEVFDATSYEWSLPEGVGANNDVIDSFKGIAKEANLSKEQMEHINTWYNKVEASQREALAAYEQKFKEDSIAELKKDWGINFDMNLSKAKKTLKELDARIPGTIDFFNNSAVGNSALMVKIFSTIGEFISEDTLTGTNKGASGVPSEEQLTQQILDNMFPSNKKK